MAKAKSRWTCQECGFQSSGYLGRCTDCGTWSSLVEELQEEPKSQGRARRGGLQEGEGPQPLSSIDTNQSTRLTTGLAGLDEVLGGGLVPGAVVLLAGDPGIGKSTLLMQVAEYISRTCKVLYVSGEESAAQVKLRASRLGAVSDNILVDASQDAVQLSERMQPSGVRVAIVDSIQSVYHPEMSSAAGSVSQVRESAQVLTNAAKSNDIATILVGHVTKEGSIAGPRVLEHMVDVVLQFEGDRSRHLRILRPVKNRFGSTQEIAIFSMTEGGLIEVDNPSALLLGDRLEKLGRRQAPSGTAVIAGGQGQRTLLLEVQALVGSTANPAPRRVANGWDYNRLLQVLAVLERKVGLNLSRHDVYVNIVGGLDFSDPSGDLGICAAVATSLLDRSVDPGLLFVGEVGLTGEVRPVVSLTQRLKEAARLGFRRALVPKGNLPLDATFETMEVVGIESLMEALTAAMPGLTISAGRQARESEPEVATSKGRFGEKRWSEDEGAPYI